jgi:hypothetical protein
MNTLLSMILIFIVIYILINPHKVGINKEPYDTAMRNNFPPSYGTKERITKDYFSNIDDPNRMSIPNLINVIENNFVDKNFYFNRANQPVNSYFPTLDDEEFVLYYRPHLHKEVKKWNSLFGDRTVIKAIDIRPKHIRETEKEFVLISTIRMDYLGEQFDLEVTHHGTRNRADDIFDYFVVYDFKLVSLRPSPPPSDISPKLDSNHTLNLSSEVALFMNRKKKMHEKENGFSYDG